MSGYWKPEIDYDRVEEFKLRNKEQRAAQREWEKDKWFIDIHPDMRLDEAMAAISHNHTLTLILASRGGR